MRALAARLTGSPDVYARSEREPEQSINFVTCHDGFTLNDLVSYNVKHNEANGEDNRDGTDDNRSWNCGVEGPSDDPEVERLRNRQVKNFLALTLLAVGTPMLLMGDEVRRTQRGNNNAYCRDDEIGWFDWTDVERHADIHRFARAADRVSLAPRSAAANASDMTLRELLGNDAGAVARRQARRAGLGRCLAQPGGHHAPARGQAPAALMVNAYWEALDFEIPPLGDDARTLAALSRHLPRLARRRLPLGRRARRSGRPRTGCNRARW